MPVPRITNDTQRIELATPRGARMIGPTEGERCPKHPRRWIMYRWTWKRGEDPTSGDAELVRGCGACNDEDGDGA